MAEGRSAPSLGRRLWRVVRVLAVYAVLSLIFWAAIPAIRRTFLLPSLFTTVAQGSVFVGAVVAVVVAWTYPQSPPKAPQPPDTLT